MCRLRLIHHDDGDDPLDLPDPKDLGQLFAAILHQLRRDPGSAMLRLDSLAHEYAGIPIP